MTDSLSFVTDRKNLQAQRGSPATVTGLDTGLPAVDVYFLARDATGPAGEGLRAAKRFVAHALFRLRPETAAAVGARARDLGLP